MKRNNARSSSITRRKFLKNATACGLGAATILTWPASRETRAGGKDGFLFVQVTDIHHVKGTHSTADVASFVRSIHAMKPAPAFVMATGDLPMGCDGLRDGQAVEAQYAGFHQVFQPVRFKKYYLIGNHDCAPDLPKNHKWFHKGAYRHFIGPLNHSFDHGGVHFICLDAQADQLPDSFLNRPSKSKMDGPAFDIIDKTALTWLRKDLSKVNPKTPIILFTHQPTWGQKNFRTLVGMFKNFNLRATFCGHWHRNNCLNERMRGGAPSPWIVSGALYGGWGGKPCADGTWRGYRLVHAQGSKVDSCYACIDRPFMGAILNVNIKYKQALRGKALIQTKIADLKNELKGVRLRLAHADPVEMKRVDRLPYWATWETKADTSGTSNGRHKLILEPYTRKNSYRYTYPVEVKNT